MIGRAFKWLRSEPIVPATRREVAAVAVLLLLLTAALGWARSIEEAGDSRAACNRQNDRTDVSFDFFNDAAAGQTRLRASAKAAGDVEAWRIADDAVDDSLENAGRLVDAVPPDLREDPDEPTTACSRAFPDPWPLSDPLGPLT